MPQIHPTSVIDGDVTLADDVVIGPGCVLNGPVSIGAGTRLIGNVYLEGPIEIGTNNRIYPFTCLGFAPQDLKWDPARSGAGLRIGNDNVFRESVTIHRATSDDDPTWIGDSNYWMANSHAGHDARISNHCVFGNGTLIAGHVRIADRVITGGNATVHQFCRIGRNAILSGSIGTGQDICPFFMLTGINVVGSINVIGLRRSGLPTDVRDDVKWVFRTLCRSGLPASTALERLRERAPERPMIAEYVEFIEGTKRGICSGRPQTYRTSVS